MRDDSGWKREKWCVGWNQNGIMEQIRKNERKSLKIEKLKTIKNIKEFYRDNYKVLIDETILRLLQKSEQQDNSLISINYELKNVYRLDMYRQLWMLKKMVQKELLKKFSEKEGIDISYLCVSIKEDEIPTVVESIPNYSPDHVYTGRTITYSQHMSNYAYSFKVTISLNNKERV